MSSGSSPVLSNGHGTTVAVEPAADGALALIELAQNGHRGSLAADRNEVAIALNGVQVTYGSASALTGVTLRVSRGERVAVIGASGAGKSTLFATLTRSLPIRRGEVVVDGLDVMKLDPRELRAVRRQIGVIYQEYGLVPQLSVGMNVAAAELPDLSPRATLSAAVRGLDADLSARVVMALDQVGLADRVGDRVADLSGGQRQRVAVARLLLQRPKLILADEPIAAVDPTNGARVMKALHGLADELGSTLLVSVHNVALARGFPRVIALRGGAVIFDGMPDELDERVLDEVYAMRSSPEQQTPRTPARKRGRCARPPELPPMGNGNGSRPGADPPAPPKPPTRRVRGILPRPRGVRGLALAVLLVALVTWSARGTDFDPIALVQGMGPIERFVSQMFPPDLSAPTLDVTVSRLLETLQMSLLGALVGAVLAAPLAMLGTAEAATVGSSRRLRVISSIPYHAARFVLNVFRSIPDILWALIFVVALGLGPFPGTLALAVHSAGVLGKLFAETLETVPTRPVDALRAIGASRSQGLLFGRLPQAAGGCASLTLYQWECNIRSATILGFVGAGGIGQEILVAMNLFDYPRVATLALATIALVLVVDRISAVVRRRLVV
jgi:phosphonate ABC transporter permease subunit PhnE